MTLLERCEGLRAEVERRNALIRESEIAKKFSERAQEIQRLREDLAGAIDRIGVLRGHGIEVRVSRSPAPTLERVNSYRQKLGDDPAASGSEHGLTKRSLDAICKALGEAAKRAIDSVIASVPSIEETFLRQVEMNPAYARDVAKIREARDKLRRYRPEDLTPAKLDEFLRERERLRGLVEHLKPGDFPKEVLAFFKAARDGGAPLDTLTETVREWFAGRDQLGRLRVRIMDE